MTDAQPTPPVSNKYTVCISILDGIVTADVISDLGGTPELMAQVFAMAAVAVQDTVKKTADQMAQAGDFGELAKFVLTYITRAKSEPGNTVVDSIQLTNLSAQEKARKQGPITDKPAGDGPITT